MTKNDKELKDLCLNNIGGISEDMMCELFDGLRSNESLIKARWEERFYQRGSEKILF